ncbi:MAG: DNA polymerase III subunit delta [Chitinophagales bacterium]|nr:DNA polymerase III subunit delta [Chitinophagales bacterium]
MVQSFPEIIRDLKNGQLANIYFLCGEEPYFSDEVEKLILKNALSDFERDFNQDILYGKDVARMSDVISICQQYPSFSQRRLVILREAQSFNKKEQWEAFESYIHQPVDTTVFVILYKHKKLDGRWSLKKVLTSSKKSVFMEAGKLRDYEIPGWINDYMTGQGYKIQHDSTKLIAESLGDDLSRVVKELDKLSLVIDKGGEITAEKIEKYIGISRDYNSFELSKSLVTKDLSKAVKIITYFSQNPKAGPFPLIITAFFSVFSGLWLYYSSSPQDLRNSAYLYKILKYKGRIDEVTTAAKFYNAQQTERALHLIAEYDAKSKGVNNKNTTDDQLLLELVYKIMR